MNDVTTVVVWAPQPGPQQALVDCPLPEIFFGGARGGGKTDGILGKWAIKSQIYGSAFNGIFFRKEMPQQDDLIERAKQIYMPLQFHWAESKKMFTSPQGARIRFRAMENDADAEKYQGQNLTDAAVEEVGNYPSSSPIDKLFGALRSAHGVPIQLILSANPGGVGHVWLKQRYIDPAPQGLVVHKRMLPNGKTHSYVYIPSRLQDNRELLVQDPDYESRLYLVGHPTLVRAWLAGDWSVVTGAFFECWDPGKHVIEPFTVPPWWTVFGSFDWGSAKPYSYGLWAVSDGSLINETRHFPAGAIIRIRESYGCVPDKPNTGLKLTAEQVATKIKLLEGGRKINYRVADPACWKVDGGPSVAERMLYAKVAFMQADNSRITGWDQVRQRLIAEDAPMLYVFNTCRDFIRTFPALQHDTKKPEDVDSDGEDHAGDDTRYACMSRPYTHRSPPPVQPIRTMQDMTFDEVVEKAKPKIIRLDGRI